MSQNQDIEDYFVTAITPISQDQLTYVPDLTINFVQSQSTFGVIQSLQNNNSSICSPCQTKIQSLMFLSRTPSLFFRESSNIIILFGCEYYFHQSCTLDSLVGSKIGGCDPPRDRISEILRRQCPDRPRRLQYMDRWHGEVLAANSNYKVVHCRWILTKYITLDQVWCFGTNETPGIDVLDFTVMVIQ